MTYQTPAPRYSRPIPASKLPPVDTLLPRHRPLLDQVVQALLLAIQRERDDRMLRIGAGLGGLAVIVATAAARALI